MHRLIRIAMVTVTIGAAACASRHVPEVFPATSAVSPEAPSAPLPAVGRIVLNEPPLPGEAADGWQGLTPSPDAAPMGDHGSQSDQGGHTTDHHHQGHAP